MRVRRLRLLGATLAALLLSPLAGCSSQDQEGEQLEVEQGEDGEQAANQEGGENAPEQDGGQEGEGGENQASQEGQEGQGGEDQQGADGEETANGGNATESDLQEIIQEMNGQQTAGADAPAGDAPLAQDAPANPPVDAAANTATPPANTAAATPPPAPAAANPIPFQPGGAPAGPGLPEPGSKMAYVVEHGDTLAKISGKIYGTPGRWNELAKLSGLANPSRIFPGDLVYYTLDESAVAFATAYEQVQRQEEQVKPGDTLATIAQRVYGDYKAWRSLWRQNDKIDNPDIIPPGTSVFYIPKGSLTAAVKKARAEMSAKAKTSKISNSNKVAKASKNIKKLDSNSKLLKSNVEIDGHKLAGSNLSNGFAALMGANLALN